MSPFPCDESVCYLMPPAAGILELSTAKEINTRSQEVQGEDC